MIGERCIIDARLKGFSPSDAWVVCVEDEQEYGQFTHPEKQISRTASGQWGGMPEIHVHADENAAILDFRAVMGLIVHVLSPTRERAMQLINRLIEFSPKKVIASGEWGMVGWKPDFGFKEFRV